MAVKSSTKKRLIELGISEKHAHKLADDANLDAIKRMTTEQVAKKVGLEMGDSVLDSIMSVISEHVGSRKRSKSNRITISRKALLELDIPPADFRFNVLNHFLVPHHELLPIDSEAEELDPWGLNQTDSYGNDRLASELLPKVLITDPAVQAIKSTTESLYDLGLAIRNELLLPHDQEDHPLHSHCINRVSKFVDCDHLGNAVEFKKILNFVIHYDITRNATTTKAYSDGKDPGLKGKTYRSLFNSEEDKLFDWLTNINEWYSRHCTGPAEDWFISVESGFLSASEDFDIDGLRAGWIVNRTVKVIRYSRSAGNSSAYRLIVESA